MNYSTITQELMTPTPNATFPTNTKDQDITHSARLAIRVIYALVFLVGVMGNSMVCYIILKRRRRKRIHIFTLNLAISDLLVLLIYLPLQVSLFENDMKWKLGHAFCRITYSLIPICIFSSIGTLVAITRDRYVAVINPLKSNISNKTRWTLILIWSVSVILTIPLTIVSDLYRGYCMEANWPSIGVEKAYWIMVFCIQFAFPVCFITVTYIIIIVHLKIDSVPAEGNNHFSRRLRSRRRQHQRLTTMIIVLVLVYVICVMPQHVVFFWFFYGNLQTVRHNLYVFLFSNLMAIANSAVNPIVYGTLNKEMKRGIKGILHCSYNNYSGSKRSKKNQRLTAFYSHRSRRDTSVSLLSSTMDRKSPPSYSEACSSRTSFVISPRNISLVPVPEIKNLNVTSDNNGNEESGKVHLHCANEKGQTKHLNLPAGYYWSRDCDQFSADDSFSSISNDEYIFRPDENFTKLPEEDHDQRDVPDDTESRSNDHRNNFTVEDQSNAKCVKAETEDRSNIKSSEKVKVGRKCSIASTDSGCNNASINTSAVTHFLQHSDQNNKDHWHCQEEHKLESLVCDFLV